VFGDDGIYSVFLTTPDQAAPGTPQGIAVFSELLLVSVTFFKDVFLVQP
jgi:hypothetical protein